MTRPDLLPAASTQVGNRANYNGLTGDPTAMAMLHHVFDEVSKLLIEDGP
jgi:hypothetical protein